MSPYTYTETEGHFLISLEDYAREVNRCESRRAEKIEVINTDLRELRGIVTAAYQHMVEALRAIDELASSRGGNPEVRAQTCLIWNAARGIYNALEFASIWRGIFVEHLSLHNPNDVYRQFTLATRLTTSYERECAGNDMGLKIVPSDIADVLAALDTCIATSEVLGVDEHTPVGIYRRCATLITERVQAALVACQTEQTPGAKTLRHPEMGDIAETNTKIMHILGGAVTWHATVAAYVCDMPDLGGWEASVMEGIADDMGEITFSSDSGETNG